VNCPGLGKKDLFQLARNGIEYIFADDGVKLDLRKIFDLAATNLDL
jgi:adenosine deaminase